ncbi:MAG: DNA primase [Pseudomonadota bacterium]
MGDLADFKARLPILPIVRRHVRLQRAGPTWKGLCPFHKEKTPSFTVTEARGTYHCFGCGAHGNGIDFLMEIEGLAFPEALERAAELTGLEPPQKARPDPERAKALALTDVLEEAARWFRERLAEPGGQDARAYLRGRGVEPATVERFELGLAPTGRDRLTSSLVARDIPLDDLVAAGLTVRPEDGGPPRDRFLDRLMFPIRDRRGRLVGFGGRALGEGAKAKYLNSAEGPLFKKRELLYGADRLDRRAGSGRLHVVEGYMDVIALAQAGLRAVAPLGTAVTAEQLKALWQLSDVPVVCLDGDAAGQRAAGRLAELAFGQLEAGRSLAFALLPDGEDPDSLLRRQGRAGFARAVEQTADLGRMLLRHVGMDRADASPEARAEARKRLREVVRGIPDADVRAEYQRELADWLAPPRRWPQTEQRVAGNLPGRARAVGGLPSRLRGAALAASLKRVEEAPALAVLGPLIREPSLLATLDEPLARVDFGAPLWDRVKDALLDYIAADEPLETESVLRHLRKLGLSAAVSAVLAQPTRAMPPGSTREELEVECRRLLERLDRRHSRGTEREIMARALASGDGPADHHAAGLDSLLNRRPAGLGDPDDSAA